MKNHLPFYITDFCLGRTVLFTLLVGLLVALGPNKVSAQGSLSVAANPATVCGGSSTTLTASGCPASGTVRWSTGQTGSSIVVAPTQATTYRATCSVTSTTVSTGTVSVQVNRGITLETLVTPVTCNGRTDGQIYLTATDGTGAFQYQLDNQPFQTDRGYGNLKPGQYQVTVKDAVGCTKQVKLEVPEPAPLAVSLTAVAAKCVGGADGGLIAVASGGTGGYQYSLNNGTPQANGTFVDLNANTTYSLTITDTKGCQLTQPVLVGAPNPFDIQLTVKPTLCAGSVDGAISVSVAGGTGPYRYQLGTNAFQTGREFTGLSANTYEITVQDASGCQGKKSVALTQPAPLRLTAVSSPVSCLGPNSGSVTVTPTGGTGAVTYQLTTTRIPQTSNVFNNLAVGTYSIAGTDANGCPDVVSVTVVKAEPLTIQVTPTPATCCICPTGAVSLTSTGGVGTKRQYQLIGQAYQPSNQITGLRPNTYRFRVADEAGCTDSVQAVVTNGSAMTLSTGTVKNVLCAGGSDAEATVQVAGGTKPFTYYWLTERRDTLRARTATQTGLSEGTYTVSVLDSNRCTTATTFITIKALNPLPSKPVITQSGITLSANQYIGIQWYVRIGTDPAKPVTDGAQATITPFQTGQYYAVVTVNGCTSPPSDPINVVVTAAEPVAGLSVRVAPNPITDRLRLEIEQVERSAVQMQLVDKSGRAIWQSQLPAFIGKKQAEWPLTNIPTGTYLLKAQAGDRQSVLRVVVE
ncbi:T9SS type A sorting domain-containing protein [Spirosoma soli]|uniref:T9SS type A sorting domain-containing protein n=1 Tax=Spirosoma soli TaxID=1770529 RepID=A0ABW5LXY1_9BACT